MTGRYADVIVDISHERVDRPFTYRIPEDMQGKLCVGQAVNVPFGKGDSQRKAYIIGFRDSVDFPPDRIKEITSTADKDLPAEAILLKLAAWMRETYGSTMIAAVSASAPAGRSLSRRRT